jgi:hypothetical protein
VIVRIRAADPLAEAAGPFDPSAMADALRRLVVAAGHRVRRTPGSAGRGRAAQSVARVRIPLRGRHVLHVRRPNPRCSDHRCAPVERRWVHAECPAPHRVITAAIQMSRASGDRWKASLTRGAAGMNDGRRERPTRAPTHSRAGDTCPGATACHAVLPTLFGRCASLGR